MALRIAKETPSELRLILAPGWRVLKAFLGIGLLGVLGAPFLFFGIQTVTVDCVRLSPGAAPDCQVLTEHVLGAYSRIERISGVTGVDYRTNTDRTRSRGGRITTTNRVELVSTSGAVSLGTGSSNLNDREKAHAVSALRQYLAATESGALHLDLNFNNVFGGIGFLLCTLVAWLLWATAMGLAFPAIVHLVRGNGVLRVRANPGKGLKSYDLGRVESVRVLEGQEAFRKVHPRVSALGGRPKAGQHGTSALRIGLADGGEVIIPNWVPEEQLRAAAEKIRDFLGLAETGANLALQPEARVGTGFVPTTESSGTFQTGTPLLRRVGGGLGFAGLILLLMGATKLLSMDLFTGFFGALPWIFPALFLLKGARTLLLIQEVTVDPPVIRVRRQLLGAPVSREETVSSFREIRLERRRTKNGEWARATLVHGGENRRNVVFAQGGKVAEIVSACERMSKLTGHPIGEKK